MHVELSSGLSAKLTFFMRKSECLAYSAVKVIAFSCLNLMHCTSVADGQYCNSMYYTLQ